MHKTAHAVATRALIIVSAQFIFYIHIAAPEKNTRIITFTRVVLHQPISYAGSLYEI